MLSQSLKPFCLGIVLCKRKLKFLYCWGRHCTGMKLCANKGMCVPKTDLVRIQGLPLKHDYLLLNECQAEIAVCGFCDLKVGILHGSYLNLNSDSAQNRRKLAQPRLSS